MRVPQVSDRVKEAPAQALRGVFAGIGQLLLITDKLRNKTPAEPAGATGPRTEPSETAPDDRCAAGGCRCAAGGAAAPLRDAAPPPRDTAAPLLDAAAPLAGYCAARPGLRPRRSRSRSRSRCGPAAAAARVTEARDSTRPATSAAQPAKKPAQPGRGQPRMPGCDGQRGAATAPGCRGARPARSGRCRCRTMTSCPSRRCARGCGTWTSGRSGSCSSTRRRTRRRAEVIAMFERRIAKLEAGA